MPAWWCSSWETEEPKNWTSEKCRMKLPLAVQGVGRLTADAGWGANKAVTKRRHCIKEGSPAQPDDTAEGQHVWGNNSLACPVHTGK